MTLEELQVIMDTDPNYWKYLDSFGGCFFIYAVIGRLVYEAPENGVYFIDHIPLKEFTEYLALSVQSGENHIIANGRKMKPLPKGAVI